MSDPWRKDNDGWARYRGKGRRGPPAESKRVDEDLGAAIDELEGAREQLAAAYRIPPSNPIARREAIKQAVAKIALATRFADDLVVRLGGEPGDCEPAPRKAAR